MSSGVLGLIIFNRGIIPIAYTGIVGGAPAPFVVPSDDEIQLLQVQIGVMTHCINSHALVGINHDIVEDRRTIRSASARSIALVDSSSNIMISNLMTESMAFPTILCRTSPTPIGLTAGFLS